MRVASASMYIRGILSELPAANCLFKVADLHINMSGAAAAGLAIRLCVE